MAVFLEATSPVLLEIVIKSLLILLLGIGITIVLRRASAASRHFVWTLTIAAVLVLPILVMTVPQANLLPRWPRSPEKVDGRLQGELSHALMAASIDDVDSTDAPEAIAGSLADLAEERNAPEGSSFGTESSPDAYPSENQSRSRFPPTVIAIGTWIVGLSFNGLGIALGLLRVIRLSRSASEISESTLNGRLQGLSIRMGVRRSVRLLKSDLCTIPATWCLRHACILVPADFECWTPERQEAVLLHELAHIARHDHEIQILTRIACSLYWFNPLIWFAARQMEKEREHVCDDAVLLLGHRPSEYAEHLLRVATRTPRRSLMIPDLSAGMARQADVGDRVRAILDTTRSREPLTRRTYLCGAVAASLIILVIGVLRPLEAIAETPTEAVVDASVEPTEDKDTLPRGALLRLGTDRFREEREVFRVEYSPDGARIASIGEGNRGITIWDAQTGEQIKNYQWMQADRAVPGFSDVAFSPDGLEIAATDYSDVYLWEVETGLQLLSFPIDWEQRLPGVGTPRLRYSPQGDRIAVSADTAILLYDTVGKFIRALTVDLQKQVRDDFCWSADGSYLSGATWRSEVIIWNTETGELAHRLNLKVERKSIFGPTISADSRLLAATVGNTVHFWKFDTGEHLKDIDLEARFVNSLVLSPDGQTLVAGGYDGSIFVVDVESGRVKHAIEGCLGHGNSLAVSPDFKTVAIGAYYPTLRQWNIETGEEKYPELTSYGHDAEIRCVAWSPDGRWIASGGMNKQINLWDAATGELKHKLPSPSSAKQIAFTPSSDQLLTYWSKYGEIRVWDVASGEEVRTIQGETKKINRFALTADGTKLVTLASSPDPDGNETGAAETLQIRDFVSGDKLRDVTFMTGRIVSMAITRDASTIVIGSAEGIIHVFNTESGTELATLLGHQHWVDALALSDDGILLASGSLDQTIYIWDAVEWKLLRVLDGHNRAVTSVAFLPNTHRLVSGSGSPGYSLFPENTQMIRVWDADSGEQIGAFSGHDTNTSAVAVSPNGQRFVSAHANTTLLIWDVASMVRK